MKHAGEAALDVNEAFLEQIRKCGDLTEKKRGVFYRKSVAFLHFHQDAAGFFADVRVGPEWRRLRASSRAERQNLLSEVKKILNESK